MTKETTREHLIEEINNQIEENRHKAEMATFFGGLGVSPKHVNMYNEAVKKIKEFEDSLMK